LESTISNKLKPNYLLAKPLQPALQQSFTTRVSGPEEPFLQEARCGIIVSLDMFGMNCSAFVSDDTEFLGPHQLLANCARPLMFAGAPAHDGETLENLLAHRFCDATGQSHFVQVETTPPVHRVFENATEGIQVQRLVEERRLERDTIAGMNGESGE
jgi:hypothetical protein